jgi:RNA recognition motif-containing protein
MQGLRTSRQDFVEETRSGSFISTIKNFGLVILSYIIFIYNSILGRSEEQNATEIPEVSSPTGGHSPIQERKDTPIQAHAPSSLSGAQQEDASLTPQESRLNQYKQLEASAPEQSVSGAAPEPGPDQTKNTIVVKNLPFKFKQTDLDSLLNDHQAHPKNVRLMRDNQGRFTGIAFIRCPSKDEASRLILSMNNLDIGGRSIQVDFKQKKRKGSKLNSSTDMGSLTSSDSEMSQPSSLRSSGEFNREALDIPKESFPQREPRRGLRLSSDNTVGVITQEHFQIPPMAQSPMMMYSHFASEMPPAYMAPPQPQAINRRLSLSNGVPTPPPSQNSYFHYQHFGMAAAAQQDRKKMDIRRSAHCDVRQEQMPHAPFERRRSIATMDDPAIRNVTRPNSVIRPPNAISKPVVAPIRQPVGPDGRTNGFSTEYRNSRTVVH